ncbi:MAG: ABC transporter substrate-binding protein [Clostridiales bacterium]|nr:ABC transporter substrate-binding protein [Clostridiales bacterium]
MKRKVISVLLVSALACSLMAGCGSSSDGSVTSNSGSTNEEAEVSGDEYSTEIDMEEDPYTVAIQVVTMPGSDNSASLEAREEAINAITVPAINCKVEIQEVWISEVANTTSMGVAGDEKIDLVHVGTVQTLSSMVGSEMLIDLNEGNLLQNRGATLVELFADTLEAGEVSGKQLAVPAKIYSSTAKGIYYNKTMADAAGVTLGETITMDELEEALIAIHEYDPSVYTYMGGDGYMSWLYSYETFGTYSSYGIIWDAEEDPTIENLYASEEFLDHCIQMQKWTSLGLQTGDTTDTTTPQDYFASQQLFCGVANVNPEQDVLFSSDDFEVASATFVDAVNTNSTVTEYMWGIAANCERPDKAMDFLNFIYENEEVANILMYGLEGTNYEYAEGSDSVIVTNGTLDTTFYYGGNTENMLIESPAGEDYIEKLEALEESATVSPVIGYMFDDTDFQTESAVISSTIDQYILQLERGNVGSEEETIELVNEFVAALEAAGINDVIAANQEQLDAYLAAQ